MMKKSKKSVAKKRRVRPGHAAPNRLSKKAKSTLREPQGERKGSIDSGRGSAHAEALEARGGGLQPAAKVTPKTAPQRAFVPGQYFLRREPIEANVRRRTVEVAVANAGDRPIQVGSHFHFFEVNRALAFDRQRAYGMRLNIPAGTAIRFEPGQKKTVWLVALGGRREVWGLNGRVNGALKS
jgi:urease subunit beta